MLVGNKGIYYIGIRLPCSPLPTSKMIALAVLLSQRLASEVGASHQSSHPTCSTYELQKAAGIGTFGAVLLMDQLHCHMHQIMLLDFGFLRTQEE